MNEFITGFDGLNELVYVADLETYDLLYLNACGLKQFGLEKREDIVGQKCYRVLQHRDAPCDFCTNHLLCKDKYYEWDIQNAVTGHQYMLKDKLVEFEGKPARLEIALDVTRRLGQERQIKTLLENEQIAMECARRLQDTGDERTSIGKTLAILGERLKGDRTYIFEIHDKRMRNTYEWCAPGIPAEKDNLQDLPTEVCRDWLKAFRSKRPYVITDLEDHKLSEAQAYALLAPQGVRSLIVVPLFEGKRLIGFLGIDNPPLENGSNIVEIMQLLAYFMQVTLTRIKANEHLLQMTYTDEMTGVKNRNAYIHDLESINAKLHAQSAAGKRTTVGVVFVDANGLKGINDSAGHDKGDALLVRIAQKIAAVFPVEQTYRTGGDEFVIVCRDMAQSTFLKNAEILKRSLCLPQRGCNDAAVGFCWSDEAVYMEEVINQAEADMYEAKRQYYTDIGEHWNELPYNTIDPTTSLLIKDRDVVTVTSELMQLLFETWDEGRLSVLLDRDFSLFEDEYKRAYQHDDAIAFLKNQLAENPGQKVRDMHFHRKRIVRGISAVSCDGRLDWKDEKKSYSIPFECSLALLQKKGRIKCVYLHCTNISFRKRCALDADDGRSMMYLNTIEKLTDTGTGNGAHSPKVEKDVHRVLEISFQLFSQEYTDVYLVDVQSDSYMVMKAEQKFHDLVGVTGNYTCVNRDYAEHYMDAENRARYMSFTDRKNLIDTWRRGKSFLSMRFAITQDVTDPYREIQVDIWMGELASGITGLLAFRNITGVADDQLAAERDSLTGLLSYEKFRADGQRLLSRAGNWAVVSTDIQNFKYINEVLGYEKGDQILKAFASSLLFVEGKIALHTRVTGDRFLTLLEYSTGTNEFVAQFRLNIENFCETQNQRNEDVKVVMRAGVYFLEEGCKSIDTAIDRANITRQAVGQSIASEVNVYNSAIIQKNSMTNVILANMEKSLDNGDFSVWIQPKVNLQTGALCGGEALVRWMRNGEIAFYPDDFIPIFENNGFITSLDFYVLEETCRCLVNWWRRGWRDIVRISVNLSVLDIVQDGIANAITEVVDRYHMDHSMLEFELTETAYFKNSSITAQVMEQLKEEGFITSVDDFGSGYSVMNMLINMPASVVKIDRMFMLNSIETEKGRVFLQKIIGIIHELGYCVLCEGIETTEQFDLLKAMGCDEGQGYYFGKAMPTEDFFTKYARL